jgi:hypothetical protein
MPAAGSSSPGGAHGGVSTQEKRLLLKYCHVLTGSLQRRQGEVERRLRELERGGRRTGKGAATRRISNSPRDDNGAEGGDGAPLQLPGWLRHPVVVLGCMFLSAGLPNESPAGRLMRAVPFLALLPSS